MGRSRTELSTAQIAEILSFYGIESAFIATRMTSGFNNVSYLLDVGDTKLILTAMDNHDAISAAALAESMLHIADCGLAGPSILPNNDGEHVTNWLEHCLMIKMYCEGTHPDPESGSHQRLVGRSIADMHLAVTSNRFPDRGRRLPETWKADLSGCQDHEFVRWLESSEQAILELGEDPTLPIGTVHGDLFPDNILIGADDAPIIIDWETVSRDVLIFDIAMTIVGFSAGGMKDSSNLLEAYESERQLKPNEHQILPQWCSYSAAVLGYRRYMKNNVMFQGSGNEDHYREIFDFWSRHELSN